MTQQVDDVRVKKDANCSEDSRRIVDTYWEDVLDAVMTTESRYGKENPQKGNAGNDGRYLHEAFKEAISGVGNFFVI